jgi:hypothetical protein
MIQRKQTLFLLAAMILTGMLLWLNLATFQSNSETWILKCSGVGQTTANGFATAIITYPILSLIITSTLISLLAIFSFKKRILQMRLCILNMAFQAGISAMIYYVGQTAASQLDAVASYNWPIIAPVIAIVFTLFALMSIRKDDALIKSLNRIR